MISPDSKPARGCERRDIMPSEPVDRGTGRLEIIAGWPPRACGAGAAAGSRPPASGRRCGSKAASRSVDRATAPKGEPGSIKDRYVMTTRPGDVLARPRPGRPRRRRARGDRLPQGLVRPAGRGPGGGAAHRRTWAAWPSPSAAATTPTSPARRRRCSRPSRAGAPGRVPSRRCPRPSGFQGRPTLVQNVETLARVPARGRRPGRLSARTRRRSSRSGETCGGRASTRCRCGRRCGAVIDELRRRRDRRPSASSSPPGRPRRRSLADQADMPLDPDDAARRRLRPGHGLAARDRRVRLPDLGGARRWPRSSSARRAGSVRRASSGSRNLARVLRAVEAGTARARDLGDLRGGGRLHVRSRLLRARPDGGGGGDGPARARAADGRGAPRRAACPRAAVVPRSVRVPARPSARPSRRRSRDAPSSSCSSLHLALGPHGHAAVRARARRARGSSSSAPRPRRS